MKQKKCYIMEKRALSTAAQEVLVCYVRWGPEEAKRACLLFAIAQLVCSRKKFLKLLKIFDGGGGRGGEEGGRGEI